MSYEDWPEYGQLLGYRWEYGLTDHTLCAEWKPKRPWVEVQSKHQRSRNPNLKARCAKVLEAIAKEDYSLLFIDLNYARDTTSGQEGLNLLAEITKLDSALPVVVMTAWATVELAVEAMRRGARDFIQKPWDNSRVQAIARTLRCEAAKSAP